MFALSRLSSENTFGRLIGGNFLLFIYVFFVFLREIFIIINISFTLAKEGKLLKVFLFGHDNQIKLIFVSLFLKHSFSFIRLDSENTMSANAKFLSFLKINFCWL